ncbi:hypothetical protein Mgra_00002559 [Meloidogyne graminicola]|uniref:Uncharacterized protein n=1 Tax=Meloidogyne graminicola TaxID=189291 RepID=A0A8S9ZW71_9BILA|nr:hypothetical protein Mgra_00002559 [Meloidogyne graminicola]
MFYLQEELYLLLIQYLLYIDR